MLFIFQICLFYLKVILIRLSSFRKGFQYFYILIYSSILFWLRFWLPISTLLLLENLQIRWRKKQHHNLNNEWFWIILVIYNGDPLFILFIYIIYISTLKEQTKFWYFKNEFNEIFGCFVFFRHSLSLEHGGLCYHDGSKMCLIKSMQL